MTAIERPRIDTPLSTGIRAIDGLLTCGKGQRMGIFAGSGVGKSVTLGMMSRYTAADVNVVGADRRARPRGQRFHRSRSGARPGQERGRRGHQRRAGLGARAGRSHRHRRRRVFSRAGQGRAAGDGFADAAGRWRSAKSAWPPASRPPRAAFRPRFSPCCPNCSNAPDARRKAASRDFTRCWSRATIRNEPICDAVRGLLDGHTWLSRKLAARGHYPAIDVLREHQPLDDGSCRRQSIARPRKRCASCWPRYRDHEDLISIGAYRRGANPTVDVAIDMQEAINDFLRQRVDEPSSVERASEALVELARRARLKTGAASA